MLHQLAKEMPATSPNSLNPIPAEDASERIRLEFYSCFIKKNIMLDKACALFASPDFPVNEEFVFFALSLLITHECLVPDQEQIKCRALLNELLNLKTVDWNKIVSESFYKVCCTKQRSDPAFRQFPLSDDLQSLLQQAVLACNVEMVARLIDKGSSICSRNHRLEASSTLELAVPADVVSTTDSEIESAVAIIRLLLQENAKLIASGAQDYINAEDIFLALSKCIKLATPDCILTIMRETPNFDSRDIAANLCDYVIEYFLNGAEDCFDGFDPEDIEPEILALFDDSHTENIKNCYRLIINHCNNIESLRELYVDISHFVRESSWNGGASKYYQILQTFGFEEDIKNADKDIFDLFRENTDYQQKINSFFREFLHEVERKILNQIAAQPPEQTRTTKKKNNQLTELQRMFFSCFKKGQLADIERAIQLFERDDFTVNNEFMLYALNSVISTLESNDHCQAMHLDLLEKLLQVEGINWEIVLGTQLYKDCVEKHLENRDYQNIRLSDTLKTILQQAVIQNRSQAVALLLARGAPIHHYTYDEDDSLLILTIYNDNNDAHEYENARENIKLILQKNTELKRNKSSHCLKNQDITQALYQSILVGYDGLVETILQNAPYYNADDIVEKLLGGVIDALKDAVSEEVDEENSIEAIFDSQRVKNILNCYKCIMSICQNKRLLQDLINKIAGFIQELELKRAPSKGYNVLKEFSDSDTSTDANDLYDAILIQGNHKLRTTIKLYFKQLQAHATKQYNKLVGDVVFDTPQKSSGKKPKNNQAGNHAVSSHVVETVELEDDDLQTSDVLLEKFAEYRQERKGDARASSSTPNRAKKVNKKAEAIKPIQMKKQYVAQASAERMVSTSSEKQNQRPKHEKRPSHGKRTDLRTTQQTAEVRQIDTPVQVIAPVCATQEFEFQQLDFPPLPPPQLAVAEPLTTQQSESQTTVTTVAVQAEHAVLVTEDTELAIVLAEEGSINNVPAEMLGDVSSLVSTHEIPQIAGVQVTPSTSPHSFFSSVGSSMVSSPRQTTPTSMLVHHTDTVPVEEEVIRANANAPVPANNYPRQPVYAPLVHTLTRQLIWQVVGVRDVHTIKPTLAVAPGDVVLGEAGGGVYMDDPNPHN